MRVALANAKGGVAKPPAASIWPPCWPGAASRWQSTTRTHSPAPAYGRPPPNRRETRYHSTCCRPTWPPSPTWAAPRPQRNGRSSTPLRKARCSTRRWPWPISSSYPPRTRRWTSIDRARHATRAALLPVRVEANTNAWAQTLATLEQTDTARFDTFIAKRQPIKTSLGMNPKQLYEYRELADELTRIAKEELA